MSRQTILDAEHMREALILAGNAAAEGEIPIGAVVVSAGRVLGRGTNRTRTDCDPTAHAEMVAIRNATQLARQHRLDGATLYVTIEPCLMCCGSLQQARISRLVYGARELRTGAVVSVYDSLMMPNSIYPHIAISEGVLGNECAALMSQFFKQRRS